MSDRVHFQGVHGATPARRYFPALLLLLFVVGGSLAVWAAARDRRVVLGVGLVLTGSVVSCLLSDVGRTARVEQLVVKRTGDLRESEQRVRQILESVQTGIVVIDAETQVIVDVNPAAEAMIGAPKQDIVGRRCHRHICPAEDGRCPILDLGQTVDNAERFLLTADGRRVPVLKTVVPVTLHGRRHLLESFVDITERERSEKVLRAQRDLGVALGAVSDLDAALQACLDVTMKVSEVDCAGIYLTNKDGGLDLAAHRGLSPQYAKAVAHLNAQLSLGCLPTTGKSTDSRRQCLPSPVDEAVCREGLTAWAIMPVYHDNQLVATVNLASRRDHEIPLWTRHAIEGFASHVGEAIARLAAEEAMRETQTNLQTLFDSMDDFAFVLDCDGRILHVNRLVRERLGYSAEELRDMPMSNLHPPDRQEEALDVLAEALMTSKTLVSTAPLVTREGMLISVETTFTRSRWSNREVLCGISRDVTERMRAERALEAACRQAEAANAAKSEFLANMSHELRTPLHGILSFATFGRKKARTAPADKLEEYFELIQQSGTNLLTLVNDLLDLSKLEACKMDFTFRQVNLHSMVLQTVDEFRSMTSDGQLAVAFDQPDGDMSVAADENRLRQVIRNLLSNAIKFSSPGGRIEIHLARKGRIIRISVRDHGIGIPEDELETVFDKFIQSSKTRTGAGGTGLGLAICREIVTAHKGRIWAESPDDGVLLVVEIPLDPRVDEPVEGPSPIVVAAPASTDPIVASAVLATYD